MIFHCSQDSLTNSFSCTITMIYNKGGKSHARNARRVALVAPRRRYSNREKALALCLVQEKMKDESISLARAACEINVPPSSIYRWRANANLPDLSTDSSDIAEKKQNHQGPEGFLDDIKDELISFITEWRDRGLPVSRFAVLQKATQYKPTFAEKSLPARYMCISRFLHANNMVHRIATHTSQKPPGGCLSGCQVLHEDGSAHVCWSYARPQVHHQHGLDKPILWFIAKVYHQCSRAANCQHAKGSRRK